MVQLLVEKNMPQNNPFKIVMLLNLFFIISKSRDEFLLAVTFLTSQGLLSVSTHDGVLIDN